MKQIFGLVNALDFSSVHCNFNRTQLTYSPNPEVINATGEDDYEVHLLYKLDSGVVTTTNLTAANKTYLMSVMKWLFDKSTDGTLTTNVEASNAALAIAFGTNDTSVVCKATRSDSNNVILPESVVINHFGDIITIWLYPPALETQYNYRQYLVAKPIVDINDFVTSNRNTLNAFLQPYLDNPYVAINAVINTRPSSQLTSYTSLWKNKDNPTETLDVDFSIAVYGPGAIDAVEVRTALKDFLLANSAHDALVWERVFPELFSISTYTLIPAYDNAVDGSIPTYYTSIATPSTYSKMFAHPDLGFDVDEVDALIDILPTVYQSISCAVMSDISNAPEASTLRYFYNDYILKSNLSPDFIRMTSTTRTFVNKLLDALPVAEGGVLTTPAGIEEEVINGVRFISFTVADCHIRMLPKSEFIRIATAIENM